MAKKPLILPKELTAGFSTSKKPTIPVEINWKHQLTKGLEFFSINDVGGHDLVNEVPASTVYGSPDYNGDYTSFSSDRYYFSSRKDIPANTGRTVATKIRFPVNITSSTYIFNAHDASVPYQVMLGVYSSNKITWLSSSVNNQDQSSALTSGMWYDVCAIKDKTAAANGKIYINGIDDTVHYSGSSAPAAVNGGQFDVAGRSTGSRDFPGDIEFIAFWSRDLSEEEYLRFYRDPYQILKPSISNIVYIGAATSGQSQTVNLITETESVLALDITQSQTVGLITETETVLQLSAEKSAFVALVQETDTVLQPNAEKLATVNLITESEIVLQPSAIKSATVGLATEADTVIGLSGEQSQVVSLVTETGSVLQASAEKSGTVNLVTESESLFSLSGSKSQTIDLVTESESVLSLAGINTQTVNLVTESESILSASAEKIGAVDIVTESESVFDAYAERMQTVNPVVETETVQPLAFELSQILDLVTENDIILALDNNLLVNVAQSKTFMLRAKEKNINLRQKYKTISLRA